MSQSQNAPNLYLDFAEDFFGAFWQRLRRRKEKLANADVAAEFVGMSNSLGAVAQAFAGRHVTLRQAEACGGFQDHVILMPRRIGLSADHATNREFFFTRAALAGAMVASEQKIPVMVGDGLEQESAYLTLAVQTARQLSHQHPGFHARMQRAAELELHSRPSLRNMYGQAAAMEQLRRSCLEALTQELWGGIPSSTLEQLNMLPKKGPGSPPVLLFGGCLRPSESADALDVVRQEEEAEGIHADASEHEAPTKDHVKRILLDQEDDPYKDAMPEHAFEKVMFAEKYEGGRRRMDGEDDMDEQQQSLDAVDLRELIRGGPEVHSIYQADIGDGEGIPDMEGTQPNERGVTYDEWNRKTNSYRRDWVTVYPTPLQGQDPELAQHLRLQLAPTVRTCRRRLERRRTERRTLDRQLDGNSLDLSAVVEEHAALHAGQTPSGRIYRHNPRLNRDLATTVLLDMSLSADSWVENRRVLDCEREAAFVLGEVAHQVGDDLQILAYSSNTRNLCRVWEIKGWKDTWAQGSQRLGLLQPQGYTRIGPAIRHATAGLQNHPARHKHILIITDAKPTDFDQYEGDYGIHDVRQAVREASAQEVRVFALGIDPKGAGILPVMFGVRGWRILPHLAELPEALVTAYGDIC